MKVYETAAKWLRTGDYLPSVGVTLTHSAQRGLRTPSGKVEIVGVRDNGKPYATTYSAGTLVMVRKV